MHEKQIVKALTGKAYAVNASGQRRRLAQGSQLNPDERIELSADAKIELVAAEAPTDVPDAPDRLAAQGLDAFLAPVEEALPGRRVKRQLAARQLDIKPEAGLGAEASADEAGHSIVRVARLTEPDPWSQHALPAEWPLEGNLPPLQENDGKPARLSSALPTSEVGTVSNTPGSIDGHTIVVREDQAQQDLVLEVTVVDPDPQQAGLRPSGEQVIRIGDSRGVYWVDAEGKLHVEFSHIQAMAEGEVLVTDLNLHTLDGTPVTKTLQIDGQNTPGSIDGNTIIVREDQAQQDIVLEVAVLDPDPNQAGLRPTDEQVISIGDSRGVYWVDAEGKLHVEFSHIQAMGEHEVLVTELGLHTLDGTPVIKVLQINGHNVPGSLDAASITLLEGQAGVVIPLALTVSDLDPGENRLQTLLERPFSSQDGTIRGRYWVDINGQVSLVMEHVPAMKAGERRHFDLDLWTQDGRAQQQTVVVLGENAPGRFESQWLMLDEHQLGAPIPIPHTVEDADPDQSRLKTMAKRPIPSEGGEVIGQYWVNGAGEAFIQLDTVTQMAEGDARSFSLNFQTEDGSLAEQPVTVVGKNDPAQVKSDGVVLHEGHREPVVVPLVVEDPDPAQNRLLPGQKNSVEFAEGQVNFEVDAPGRLVVQLETKKDLTQAVKLNVPVKTLDGSVGEVTVQVLPDTAYSITIAPPSQQPLTLIYVIDSSGSMGHDNKTLGLMQAIQSDLQRYKAMAQPVKVAFVQFTDRSIDGLQDMHSPETANKPLHTVDEALSLVRNGTLDRNAAYNHGTDVLTGLERVQQKIKQGDIDSSNPVLVTVISDAQQDLVHNDERMSQWRQFLQRSDQLNVRVIGVGEENENSSGHLTSREILLAIANGEESYVFAANQYADVQKYMPSTGVYQSRLKLSQAGIVRSVEFAGQHYQFSSDGTLEQVNGQPMQADSNHAAYKDSRLLLQNSEIKIEFDIHKKMLLVTQINPDDATVDDHLKIGFQAGEQYSTVDYSIKLADEFNQPLLISSHEILTDKHAKPGNVILGSSEHEFISLDQSTSTSVSIHAGDGDDIVYANEQWWLPRGDQLYGEGGNDTLIGRKGNDILEGGDGNDYLLGGQGSNRLTGGAGQDRFIIDHNLHEKPEVDVITDFNPAEDKLDLRHFARINGKPYAEVHSGKSGDDYVELQLKSHFHSVDKWRTVRLEGVTAETLGLPESGPVAWDQLSHLLESGQYFPQ